MKRLKEDSFLFVLGSFLYSLLEVLWRGYTHWSMALTGGACLILMYRTDIKFEKDSLFKKCLFGSVIITSLEFIVGCIVNILFKWKIWDYSHSAFNILGQICLPFTILWFFISLPVVYFSKFIRNFIFERKTLTQN